MKTNLNKSGIYQIRNIINNKVYIGSAVNFRNRWYEHKKLLIKNKHENSYLQNAWNKYGEKVFIFEILEEVLEKSNLINAEQHYIDNLEPEYNICKIAGSTLGYKHTEGTLKKMSNSHKGLQVGEKNGMFGKKGKNAPNYGVRFSKEHCNKISIAMSGKCPSEETRRKISLSKIGNRPGNSKLTDKQVLEIRSFYKNGTKKIKEIEDLFNISQSSVYKVINNRTYKNVQVNNYEV